MHTYLPVKDRDLLSNNKMTIKYVKTISSSFFPDRSRMPIYHVVSFLSGGVAKISKVNSWRKLYRLRKFPMVAAAVNIKIRVSHQRVKKYNKSCRRPGAVSDEDVKKERMSRTISQCNYVGEKMSFAHRSVVNADACARARAREGGRPVKARI